MSVCVHRLDAMCSRLRMSLGAEPVIEGSGETRREHASQLARLLPLVHRSVTAGGPTLATILDERHLRARPPCTSRELECGVPRALYFFLGCAAYPEGAVAFLVSTQVLDQGNASYTPFDTGSLDRYARPRDRERTWEDADRLEFLATHLGHGADAVGFAAEYMAAHFASATDYVCRPQRSEPDRPVYHGLESMTGDRRAWSIEIQFHEDLPLDAEHIDKLVLGQHDLLADIPDDLTAKVVVAEDEGAVASTIHRLIILKISA
jgi:hypothetical protein